MCDEARCATTRASLNSECWSWQAPLTSHARAQAALTSHGRADEYHRRWPAGRGQGDASGASGAHPGAASRRGGRPAARRPGAGHAPRLHSPAVHGCRAACPRRPDHPDYRAAAGPAGREGRRHSRRLPAYGVAGQGVGRLVRPAQRREQGRRDRAVPQGVARGGARAHEGPLDLPTMWPRLSHPARGATEAGQCDVCGAPLFQRSDEAPEIQARRYEVYEQDTLPMVDYYRQRGILVEINGEQDVENVTRDILAAIDARKAALIALELRVTAKRLQPAAD